MSKCKVVVGQLGLGRIFEFHIFGLVLCLSFFRVVFLFLLPYFSSPWSLSSSLLSIMIVLFCSKTSWHCSSFDNYHGIIRIQLLVPERSMGAWILSSRLSKKDSVHIQPDHQYQSQERIPNAVAQVLPFRSTYLGRTAMKACLNWRLWVLLTKDLLSLKLGNKSVRSQHTCFVHMATSVLWLPRVISG